MKSKLLYQQQSCEAPTITTITKPQIHNYYNNKIVKSQPRQENNHLVPTITTTTKS